MLLQESYWTKGSYWLSKSSLRKIYCRQYDLVDLWNICLNKWPWICSNCLNTSWSFLHSWLITGFVTRLTRWVPLAEQKLPAVPVHLSWPPVFSGVHVIRTLVLCVCIVDRFLSFCTCFLLAIVMSVLRYTDSEYPLVSWNSSW